MYSIDTVHTSYLAAKSRVRQYTYLMTLLKHAEDSWAQRLQEAGYVVMDQSLHRVALDGIEVEDDEQDVLLKFATDTVFANYIAAQQRVRQYTQFLIILRREEDAWAQRLEKVSSYSTNMYSGYDLKLFFACHIVMGTYLVLPNGDDSNLNAWTQSCAIYCSWKRDTDFHGLSRHCSTCHHYQKASTLAMQKRRDQARELVEALQKSTPQLTTSSTSTLSTYLTHKDPPLKAYSFL
ncbi:hypothetical protein BD769DRAFT_1397428 [Suillus cothurnatus]|nr:hypothetical protein BD769DRAFT_1397428 [Suillus cothurnatus]